MDALDFFGRTGELHNSPGYAKTYHAPLIVFSRVPHR